MCHPVLFGVGKARLSLYQTMNHIDDTRAGWWTCYYEFAARLLDTSTGRDTCLGILADAGILEEEAWQWLDAAGGRNIRVDNLVRDYISLNEQHYERENSN